MATSPTQETDRSQTPESQTPEWEAQKRRREILVKLGTTTFAAAVLAVFLMPMGYAFVTSLKTRQQAADPSAPILPAVAVTIEYEGEEVELFEVCARQDRH